MPLNVARLGTPFATGKKPHGRLLKFLEDNYTLAAPAKANVKFRRNFKDMSGVNFVIVTLLRDTFPAIEIGNGRYRHAQQYFVQIRCLGIKAEEDLDEMADHIETIINNNPLAIQTVESVESGIEQFEINNFTPLTLTDTSKTNRGMSGDSRNEYGRVAICTLYFDKLRS